MNESIDAKARLAPPALLLAVASISFAAIFFRLAMPTHPLVAAGIRLAVAAVVLLPLAVRSAARRRPTRKLLLAAVLAGLLYGIHFGAWVTSLTLTSIAASVTLVTTTPLLLAALGALTGRDRPDRRLWLLLALAFCGLVLIGGVDLRFGPARLAGDGLALAGAGAMAAYLLVGRWLGEQMDLWVFSGIACAVGSAVLLGAAAGCGIPIRAASTEALAYLVLAALVPQLIGHNLLTWSLRHTKPMVVGMAVIGEPVGATALGWLWLGEAVAPLVAAGCLLTLAAVVLSIASSRTARPVEG